MIYLSGHIRRELVGARPDIGFIITPRMRQTADLTETLWAGDNGCFVDGDAFELDPFLAFLDRHGRYRGTCLFAVAPDVLGDAEATWERSRPVLPILRAMGYKAALVAQDGIESMAIAWDAFDVLFIGGTTAWKLSHHAREVVAEARRRGKWVHMGRVNSELRARTAQMWGCGSVDGTLLAFGPDLNTPRLLAFLDRMAVQPQLVYGNGR